MKEYDFNNPKVYCIKSSYKPITLNDINLDTLGHSMGGYSTSILEASEMQGLSHLFTLNEQTSSSIDSIRWFLNEKFLMNSELIQEHNGMIYIYIFDRKEITNIIENYMKMSCYSLEGKSYLPEVIRGERWLEYKFKALYPIEKDE